MKLGFYKKEDQGKTPVILASILILAISYFTYFHNYASPQGVFWDENYHIPAAQKYINRIFFMYDHPPLGPMLVALGEMLLQANQSSDQFINMYYAKDFTPDFSFAGYRLLPVICAWLLPLIFFYIALNLVNDTIIAFLLSFLCLFENAMIVHFRGAMLDAPLILFVAFCILFFVLALKNVNHGYRLMLCSVGFGGSLGLVATTKLTGLIIVLLVPLLFSKIFPNWKMALLSVGCISLSFMIIVVMIWQIHFLIAKNINPNLSNSGYFNISAEYRQLINENKQNDIASFPLKIQEHFDHVKMHQQGVPKLDLTKPTENGSPSLFWPFGARAINYRWETPDGISYKYLYLQVNPVIWFLGLVGVLGTSALVFVYLFFPLQKPLKNRFLMATFLLLYWSYMLLISQLSRVMYLYHYFPALLFSFCLFVLLLEEARKIGNITLNTRRKILILSALAAAIFVSYRFYSPLTYYQPLTDEQFRQRMIFPLWDLRCVKCERTGFFKP